MHEYAKSARVSWIADHIDSTMAQTLATRAYQAANRVEQARVRFVEGKASLAWRASATTRQRFVLDNGRWR